MKFVLVILSLCFISCASTTNKNVRTPSSETKTINLTVPVEHITSIVTFPGATSCTKEERKNIRGKYFTYNCAHVMPISFFVVSPAAGINKKFNTYHTTSYQNMYSKTDISVSPGADRFHAEQENLAKTYVQDLASGCYGSNVEVVVTNNDLREEASLKHNAYFGKVRCQGLKAFGYAKAVTVNSWENIKGGAQNTKDSVVEHVQSIGEGADNFQKNARDKAADVLKYLADSIDAQ